ncbi:putative homing endonuclease protein [Rhizobium phage RHph_I1_18]|nr:putative homing endonuclease protein [Rhizobium phage RHph_I1_18]
MSKYGFVYIWFDRKHKRYYVGCHWGHENDRYICSSRWMRESYKRRPQDFKRRIIVSNIATREDTISEETKWLQLIKSEELGKRYYNFINKGFAHWSHDDLERIRVSRITSLKNKGKHHSPDTELKKGQRHSPKTEFKKGVVPHNKGKKLEDVVGEDRAKEMKQAKSDRYKGKSFSPDTQIKKGERVGAANIRARAILTPFGRFETMTEAANQLNLTNALISHRVRSKFQPDWQYV